MLWAFLAIMLGILGALLFRCAKEREAAMARTE